MVSYLALNEHNLDDWEWVGNGSSVWKWRTEEGNCVPTPRRTAISAVLNLFWIKNSSLSLEILYLGLPELPWNTFPALYITSFSFNLKQSRASLTTVTTLSSTNPISKHLSIISYRQSIRYYCTWSKVSEELFPDFSCLKISKRTLRIWRKHKS